MKVFSDKQMFCRLQSVAALDKTRKPLPVMLSFARLLLLLLAVSYKKLNTHH